MGIHYFKVIFQSNLCSSSTVTTRQEVLHKLWLLLWQDLPKAVRQSTCCKSLLLPALIWSRQLMALLPQDVNMDRMRCCGCAQAPPQAGKHLKDREALTGLGCASGWDWHLPAGSKRTEGGRGVAESGRLVSPRTGSRSTAVCKQGVPVRTRCLQVHPPIPDVPQAPHFPLITRSHLKAQTSQTTANSHHALI